MVLGDGPGTAFHRLQAHTEALAQVTETSPLFGYLLKQIQVGIFRNLCNHHMKYNHIKLQSDAMSLLHYLTFLKT